MSLVFVFNFLFFDKNFLSTKSEEYPLNYAKITSTTESNTMIFFGSEILSFLVYVVKTKKKVLSAFKEKLDAILNFYNYYVIV